MTLGLLFIFPHLVFPFHDTFSLTILCPWSGVPCWCLGFTSCTHLLLNCGCIQSSCTLYLCQDFWIVPYTGLHHSCSTPTNNLCFKLWVAAKTFLIPCCLFPIYVNNCQSIYNGCSPIRILVHPIHNVSCHIGLVY